MLNSFKKVRATGAVVDTEGLQVLASQTILELRPGTPQPVLTRSWSRSFRHR